MNEIKIKYNYYNPVLTLKLLFTMGYFPYFDIQLKTAIL